MSSDIWTIIWDIFCDNFFFSLFIGKKQWRKKKNERELKHNVSMREKIVKKLSQSNCTNIISLKKYKKVWRLIKHWEMLTCAFKTQVNESNMKIIYWKVCIVFDF